MMANENMEEWGALGWVELETIRATIEAFAKGLIKLPEVPKNSPNVREVSEGSRLLKYTKATVAEFLGWTSKNNGGKTLRPNNACEVSFMAIDAIDEKLIKASDLRDLTRGQIYNLIVRLCKDNKPALDAIDKATQGETGVNNGNTRSRPVGNSEQAAIRRLRKDRPDLHRQVLAGA
jgi:hypothetical protein